MITRKKSIILALVAFLGSLLFISCKEKELINPCFRSPWYIQEYAVTPEFVGGIFHEYSQHDDRNMKIAVDVDTREQATTRILNHIRHQDEFLPYARRYNDLSYNGCHPTPCGTMSLAEPLTKIRCYEATSSGEFMDVSDKLCFRALTFLPFIRSGYKYREQCEAPVGPHRFGIMDYLVNKPLLSLSEEDLTLLDCKDWTYVFELVPIEPYRINKEGLYNVVIEENGNRHEVKAKLKSWLP